MMLNATNWATPFSVRVSNNPNAPVVAGPPVQSFPAQPHLASLLQGLLLPKLQAVLPQGLPPSRLPAALLQGLLLPGV